jgi:hypothetical protein
MQLFSRTSHITEKAMQLYAVGDLPEYGCREIVEHLSSCRYCQQQMADVERFLTVVGIPSRQDRSRAFGVLTSA